MIRDCLVQVQELALVVSANKCLSICQSVTLSPSQSVNQSNKKPEFLRERQMSFLSSFFPATPPRQFPSITWDFFAGGGGGERGQNKANKKCFFRASPRSVQSRRGGGLMKQLNGRTTFGVRDWQARRAVFC